MTFDELARKLRDNFPEDHCEEFVRDCARGLAAELRRRTVERTPIGNYSGDPYVCESGLSHPGRKVKGRHGGTLRSSWHTSRVTQSGNKYVVTLKNTALSNKGIPYGLYVESGYAKKFKNKETGEKEIREIDGHRMLKRSRDEVQDAAQGYIEKKLNRKMRGIFR